MAEPTTRPGWRGATVWSVVFALNLALPLPLGLLATQSDGQIGVGLAVFVWWAVGLMICLRSAALGPVLIRGGVCVGVLQFFPMLHLAAGVSALLVWQAVSGGEPLQTTGPAAVLGGFVLTITTGAALLVAAFLFGGGFRLLRAPPATEQTADFGEVVRRAAED